jgi:hypothetical protein
MRKYVQCLCTDIFNIETVGRVIAEGLLQDSYCGASDSVLMASCLIRGGRRDTGAMFSSSFVGYPMLTSEPGQRSRYSDWLRTGRPRGRSSSPGRVKNFLFSTSSRPALGPTQPPFQWVPVERRPEREVDHLPLTNAEVNKTWIYTSIPPYSFMT